MATEQVRMWRPPGEDRVLLMAGRTTRYAVEPRGEYVVGVVADQPMRSRRGRERRLVCPGQLVVWDPFSPHSGTAVDDRPWWSRLMVIEIDALAAFAGGQEPTLLDGVAFPEPVVSDAELVRGFLRLHAALEAPMTRLERDERLAGWLRALVERSTATRMPRLPLNPRDDRALRRACAYLAERPERNVGLDELADDAGVDKFRLVHLFRERIGLPPHALQIAHRVHHARRLLEAGQTVAATAAATGFADQSHLHRHFQRTLGLTPGEYRQRFAGTGGRRSPTHRRARTPAGSGH
jgi:AraC-like DNA-binding protein